MTVHRVPAPSSHPSVRTINDRSRGQRAARRGNYDAAVALLDGGADPNLFDSIWTRPGWSPLMNAVHKSQPRIVKLLIEHGADVNAHTTDGTTPLALSEDKDIADMLVARLDPVSRGPHGQR